MPNLNDQQSLINNLKKISKYAFDEKNNLLSIQEQHIVQENIKSWSDMIGEQFVYQPFIVAITTKDLNVPELKEKPLVFTRASIRHAWKKHASDFSFDDYIKTVKDINWELKRNVLAFQDPNNLNKICFVLDKKSEKDNDLMCIILTGFQASCIEINKITSIHSKKDLLKKINLCFNKNLKIYTNKNTGKWLAATEMDIFNGDNTLCLTKHRLIALYYKQNNIKSQVDNLEDVRRYNFYKNQNVDVGIVCHTDSRYVKPIPKINKPQPNNNRNAHTGVKKTNPNRGCKNKNKSI